MNRPMIKLRNGAEKPETTVENRMVGYARVSTVAQNLDLQLRALRNAGVKDDDLFWDKISGATTKRVGFDRMKKHLVPGDTLVIYSLSRAGRSVRHLIDFNKWLLDEGVSLKSITEEIDTRSAMGKMIFHLLAAFAQFERDLTIERTRDGMAAKAARGFVAGRPGKLSPAKLKQLRKMVVTRKDLTLAQIGAKFGLKGATVSYHCPGGRQGIV